MNFLLLQKENSTDSGPSLVLQLLTAEQGRLVSVLPVSIMDLVF